MWAFSRCGVVHCIVLVDAGGPTLSVTCVRRYLRCGIAQFDCNPAYLRPIGIDLLGERVLRVAEGDLGHMLA